MRYEVKKISENSNSIQYHVGDLVLAKFIALYEGPNVIKKQKQGSSFLNNLDTFTDRETFNSLLLIPYYVKKTLSNKSQEISHHEDQRTLDPKKKPDSPNEKNNQHLKNFISFLHTKLHKLPALLLKNIFNKKTVFFTRTIQTKEVSSMDTDLPN